MKRNYEQVMDEDDEPPSKKSNKLCLIDAVLRGNYEKVNLILLNCYDVNVTDYCGNTPLHYAAYKGDIDIVSLLCEAKANNNVQNWLGYLPIHNAAISGNLEVFHYLISYNSIFYDAEENDGMTPFAFACIHGHLEIVKYIIEELDVVPNPIYGCKYNKIDVVKYLLDKGGKPCIEGVYHSICSKDVNLFNIIVSKLDTLDTKYGDNNIVQMITKYGIPEMHIAFQQRLQELVKINKLSDILDRFYL